MAWNDRSAAIAEHEWPGLVPLDGEPISESSRAFAKSRDERMDLRPPVVARAKQALLDDLRILVLQGVEPRLSADGERPNPSGALL